MIAQLRWYCVVCGDSGIADALLNLVLFFPLGNAARALGLRFAPAVAGMLALSVSIELIQATLLVGRDASLGDVLSNTLGGTLGWVAWAGLVVLARPTTRIARRGVAAILAMMAVLWFATAAALQPALTDGTPWLGQPLNEWPGYQPFPGTILGATINGMPIPDEQLAELPRWRDSIAVEVDATRSSGELFSQGISLVRIVDTTGDLQLEVVQLGGDARLRVRLRAREWLLHNPSWIVPGAMRMTPGQPWRFRWWWQKDRFLITSALRDRPPPPAIAVPLSIGLGWAFIHPFVSRVGPSAPLWTALWLGWWFGWLGWLAAWLTARAQVLVGVAGVTLYLTASLACVLPVQLDEVGFAAIGYTLLLTIARMRMRRSAAMAEEPSLS